VLELEPVAVINAGLVPNKHDFLALGCAVSELVCGATLNHRHVMGFLLAVFWVGHSEATHVVASHVHPKEVPGRNGTEFTKRAFGFGIETGGIFDNARPQRRGPNLKVRHIWRKDWEFR